MARPKAKYKNEKFLFTLSPLMKARLDAQADWETKQQADEMEISRGMILRKGLEVYLRSNKLPEGYLEEYIRANYDEEQQEKLFEMLHQQRKVNNEIY
jgi:hypothetical protein